MNSQTYFTQRMIGYGCRFLFGSAGACALLWFAATTSAIAATVPETYISPLLLSASSAEGPASLAHNFEVAITSGDIDAELALFDQVGVAADDLFYFMDFANDCFEGFDCQVKALPLTDRFRDRVKQMQRFGKEYFVPPEGLLKVSMDLADEHLEVELPYASLGGRYKIIGPRLSLQRTAELKSKTAYQIAEELLAGGIGTPPDKHWKDRASPLPPGGGKAGAAINAWIARIAAISAAVKANDPDAMVTLAENPGEMFPYRKVESDGTPVSLKKRQGRLRAQAMAFTTDVKVLGGYSRGDVYALVWEGHDGAGWLLRGCTIAIIKSGKWTLIDSRRITIPPD